MSRPPQSHDFTVVQNMLSDLESFLTSYDELSVTISDSFVLIPSHTIGFDQINEISKGKFFNCSELNSIALIFEAYGNCFRHFSDYYISENLKIGPDIYQKIKREFIYSLREFVGRDGQAHYDRHPELKKLYAEVIDLENDLRNLIHKISKTDLYKERLQFDQFDIINDRYVLAVRSDSYQSELGPIVARSNSGMTLFVEPFEIRMKSNHRLQLLAQIESIILKLTIGLSETLHTFALEFKKIAIFVLNLDELSTKAKYTLSKNLIKPILNDKFSIMIDGFFHPLIDGAVTNDLKILNHQKGLIISGPNTGGKTVALKCLAICTLFCHMGMYIPAKSAQLYLFDSLFYFSHDHQNLEAGLSSFASEAKYYLALLESLGDKNLILIDEIFNSTSSEEASALAIAFLEELHRRSSSKVILSTHHQVLKTFMHANKEYVSAHVGFNFEENLPTYKLIVGEPGSSLAFKIFENLQKKFNHATNISKRSKELLDQKQVTYESLLQELSSKKGDLERLINSNNALNKDLKNQKQAMDGILHLEKEKVLKEYEKKLALSLKEAEKLFNEIREEKILSAKNLASRIHAIKSTIENSPKPKLVPSEDQIEKYSHFKELSFDDLQIGMNVFALNLGKHVRINQINSKKKEVQVKHGSILVWLPFINLRLPDGVQIKKPQVIVNVERESLGKIEIDCRGMRLEDFQKQCEKALEDIYSGEIPFINIIHGHGSGILKSWLRNYLKKEHKDLKFENIEGNDGCTKVFL